MSAVRSGVLFCSLLTAHCPLLAGCQQKMANQPRYGPLEPSRFFPDGQSARHPVAGSRPRDGERTDRHLFTGTRPGAPPVGGKERPAPALDRAAEYEEAFPFAVTPDAMRRGRERFNISCAACHGPLGAGDGPVVRAGYPQAQSFHTERLRQAPAGYLFDVVTRGYQKMPAFAGQITPRDRWSVVAYVRALQLSQHAELKSLPPELRKRFERRRRRRP